MKNAGINQKNSSWYFLRFYSISALITIVAIMLWRVEVFQRQEASFHWPIATGTVLQSARTYVQSGNNSHYRADVVYQYNVAGVRYESHQISLWSSDLSYNDPEGFVSSHPTGSEATVYYDPTHPGTAVLVPGGDDQLNKMLMGGGAFIIATCAFGIFHSLRKQARLAALSNAPDSLNRTIELKRAETQKGINSLHLNLLVAFGFIIVAIVCFM